MPRQDEKVADCDACGDPVTYAQLRRWTDAGGRHNEHWGCRHVDKPSEASVTVPDVRSSDPDGPEKETT